MGLAEYKRKRNFGKTPEPSGKVAASGGALKFVVQKHAASRLHYDFRLELDGTLKSWAVPKGPSLDPSVKALAVHVEDHPLDYADFEGVIPAGQYGGGTVMVWDQGDWTPEGELPPEKAYRQGKLKFSLHGQKLKGSWALVRMGGRAGEDGKNWLLIKHDDSYAKPIADFDVTVKRAKSVVSKRTLEQIAAAADRVWSSNKSSDGAHATQPRTLKKKAAVRKKAATSAAKKPVKRAKKAATAKKSLARKRTPRRSGPKSSSKKSIDASGLPGARMAAMPNELSPQLATLSTSAPTGENWLHELKFDGYRMLAIIDRGNVRLVTRRGNDWSHRFAAIIEALPQLPVTSAIIDGEVVSLNAEGISDFQQLQNQLKRGDEGDLVYYAFDLPYAQGYDLRAAPLSERKELLARLFPRSGATADNRIRYSDHIAGEGAEVLEQACQRGLEGIVSKRADSPYTSTRSPNWLKTKCTKRQEFVIGGYTRPEGARKGFGALLLGYYEGRELKYAGRVGTGFTEQTLRDVHRELAREKADDAPFSDPPRGAGARGVTWVRPKLVGEVEFTEWTDEGLLRHPSFQGLREDKPATQITREEAQYMPNRTGSNGKASRVKSPTKQRPAADRPAAKSKAKMADAKARSSDGAVVEGVAISHPDRVLYPGHGVTKLDLAKYYQRVSEWILPYVENRPLTLVRCPQGQAKQCFYQKHITGEMPAGLRGVMIQEKDEQDEYLVVDDLPGLISLVQIGVLEMHPWPARADKLERPDMLVFDLDPGEGVEWPAIVQAARDVRECLEALGLQSFLRTSGGKGLHIVAPLGRRNDWDEFKAFAKGVADTMVRAAPDRYIATMSKAKRRGKVFVDYLRNQRGATAVASYSTRARSGAPVATPLAWDELSTKLKADKYTVQNLFKRLDALPADPWAEFHAMSQSITKTMLKAVGA